MASEVPSHEDHPQFRLRAVEESDTAAILEIYAPIVRKTAISFELEVPPTDEMRARIRKHTEFAPWLIAEAAGVCLGYAYGSQFRGREAYRLSVETTVYVSDTTRRSGVGTALYRALLVALKERGFQMAIAGITLPNDASVQFHERFGFEAVGVFHRVGRKFDAWHDVGFWERDLSG